MRSVFRGWVRLAVLLVATAGAAQTFDVNGQASSRLRLRQKTRPAIQQAARQR